MLPRSGADNGTSADGGSGVGNADATKAAASSTAWLHCSVGPKMEEGETEDGLKQQVRAHSSGSSMDKDGGREYAVRRTCLRRHPPRQVQHTYATSSSNLVPFDVYRKLN